jgi:hypothetical protein
MSDKEQQHDVIWLSPCAHDFESGRTWCKDNIYSPCEECGRLPVKYVIADEIDRLLRICKDKTVLLQAAYAGNERRDAEIDRLRAVLRDAQTAMEERWGITGSRPHLLEKIRQALAYGHGTVPR